MKNALRILALFAICLCYFPSCCDDDTPTMPAHTVDDYFPLETGAFWVYETYTEAIGEEPELLYIDTVSVLDSYQDGEDTVYELSMSDQYLFSVFFPEQIRLSGGELFTANGSLLLSVDENQAGEILRADSLSADLGFVNYRFLNETEIIESPAGTFECINFQGEIVASDPEAAADGFLINNFYSAGVGLVKANTFFFSNGNKVEIRLVSFELP